jgi:hypothetical protein
LTLDAIWRRRHDINEVTCLHHFDDGWVSDLNRDGDKPLIYFKSIFAGLVARQKQHHQGERPDANV